MEAKTENNTTLRHDEGQKIFDKYRGKETTSSAGFDRHRPDDIQPIPLFLMDSLK